MNIVGLILSAWLLAAPAQTPVLPGPGDRTRVIPPNITLVQHPRLLCSAGNASCTVSVSSTGASHALIAGVALQNGGNCISSVSGGGTWNLCPSYGCCAYSSYNGVDMAYVTSSASGTTSITVHLTGAPTYAWAVEILEYAPTSGRSFSLNTYGKVNDNSCTSCAGVGLSLGSTNSFVVQTASSANWNNTAISGTYTNPYDGFGQFYLFAGSINTTDGTAPTITINSSNPVSVSAVALKEQ